MTGPLEIDALAAAVLVPVITVDDAATAAELGDALARGGLTVVEVTLRTPAGLPAIAAMAADPRLTVGAGTVLDPDSVDRAVDAGAQFVVSPGLDKDVVDRTIERAVLPLPGIATASEAQSALRCGLTACKFFPADALGGVAAIRALAGPFGMLRFVPSGGITLENAAEYLAEPAVAAVCGSWLTPADALREHDWDRIERLARTAVDTVRPDPPGAQDRR